MTDDGPFANWPHLDRPAPPAESRDILLLPSATESQPMASRNAFENFLGGSPLYVAVRLFFVSLVVGALLMWLELRPTRLQLGNQSISVADREHTGEPEMAFLRDGALVVESWQSGSNG